MLQNNLPDKDSLFSTLVWPVIATLVLLVVGNGVLYYYYYSDLLSNRSLPYFEDFSTAWYVEYRQIKGNWALEDERLVQQNSDFADLYAVIPALELSPDQNYEFSVHATILEGPKGGGLIFNMQHPDKLTSSHLMRLGTNEEGDYLIYGYFDAEREFVFQGSLSPENLADDFQLGVRTEGQTYSILLNDVVVAEGVELAHNGGLLALTTWNSKVAFDDVSVSPVSGTGAVVEGLPAEPEAVEAAAPAEAAAESEPQPEAAAPASDTAGLTEIAFFEDFTSKTELDYSVPKGEWALQNEAIVQSNAQDVDTAAILPGVTLAAGQPFKFQAGLTVLEGAKGGGVLFNLQQSDSILQSHMVRLGQREDGSEYVLYGSFDENGGFNAQGSAAPLGYESTTSLAIEASQTTYNILQNDQVIASDIPFVYQGGGVGLTTWNTAVQFDDISVNGLGTAPAAEQATADTAEAQPAEQAAPAETSAEVVPYFEDFAGDTELAFVTTDGSWQLQEEALLQSDPSFIDIMALVPDVDIREGESYAFAADLRILDGPKGGGLVFNAQNSDSIRESHMVRFGTGDAGDYVVHGYFDAERRFVGTGAVQLENIPESARLGIEVEGNTFRILIDDVVVVTDAPLAYSSGKVGFTTWNSSVSFDNISVER